jgi:hypothetical protein
VKKRCSAILLLTLACGLSDAADSQADQAQENPRAPTELTDPTAGRPGVRPAPNAAPQTGAIDPASGQYYPPTGNGDVINPATGERYIGIPGGYLHPRTGEILPTIR